MTVDELKDWMDERLQTTEKMIQGQCQLRHTAIDVDLINLKRDVKGHDRWVSGMKGMWAVLVVIGGLLVKLFWGGK